MRVYNADGTAATGEFIVNQHLLNWQLTQGHVVENVTELANGNIAVTWYSNQNGEGDVYTRVFTPAGVAVSDESRVSGAGTHEEQASVAALADGDYVVVFVSNAEGSGAGIYAQRYNADGTKDGDTVLVNTWTAESQYAPQAQALDDGGYVIVWQSYGVDGDATWSISGQRFDSSGNKVGGEFIINADNSLHQDLPSIALRADGALVATWRSTDRIEQKIIDDFTGGTAEAKNLTGGDGNDSFIGSDLADMLDGAGGDDRLYGGAGTDSLYGGSGSDLLDGGADNDTLAGGGDPDTFVLATGTGSDTVLDWSEEDQIRIAEQTQPADFAAWLAEHVAVVDGNTIVDLDGSGPGTDTLVLQGFTGMLNSSDFLFGL